MEICRGYPRARIISVKSVGNTGSQKAAALGKELALNIAQAFPSFSNLLRVCVRVCVCLQRPKGDLLYLLVALLWGFQALHRHLCLAFYQRGIWDLNLGPLAFKAEA